MESSIRRCCKGATTLTKSKDNKYLTLEEYIVKQLGDKKNDQYSFLSKLHKDVVEGKVILMDPSPPKDFLEYLTRPDYSLWLWSIIFLQLLAIISIVLTNTVEAFLYVRYIVGSLVVLFLPGYVTVEVLYPSEKELSSLERLALSIGLSLAVVPLIGLILNYTPWGIRLTPVVSFLTVYTLMMALFAGYRKYKYFEKTKSGLNI